MLDTNHKLKASLFILKRLLLFIKNGTKARKRINQNYRK